MSIVSNDGEGEGGGVEGEVGVFWGLRLTYVNALN